MDAISTDQSAQPLSLPPLCPSPQLALLLPPSLAFLAFPVSKYRFLPLSPLFRHYCDL